MRRDSDACVAEAKTCGGWKGSHLAEGLTMQCNRSRRAATWPQGRLFYACEFRQRQACLIKLDLDWPCTVSVIEHNNILPLRQAEQIYEC
jgi:hypothetical protein